MDSVPAISCGQDKFISRQGLFCARMLKKLLPALLFIPFITCAQWQIDTALPGVNAMDGMLFNQQLYAISNANLYRTSDQTNWEIITNGFAQGWVSAVGHSQGNLITAGFDGIYTSLDSGQTWMQSLEDPRGAVKRIMSLDARVLLLTFEAIYKSEDAGLSWEEVPTDPFAGGIDMAMTSSGRLFLADQEKFFYSDDTTQTWTEISNFGLEDNWVQSLFATGETVLAGGPEGLVISNDNGNSWSYQRNFNGNIYSAYIDDQFLFVGSQSKLNVLDRSDTTGQWIEIADVGFRINKFLRDASNYYCLTEEQILRSSNGIDWNPIGNEINSFSVGGVSKNDTSIVVYRNRNLLISSQTNSQWRSYNQGIENRITHFVDLENGLASTSSGMFKIVGNKWEQIYELPSNRGFRRFHVDGSTITGVNLDGIHFSVDNGATWQVIEIPDLGLNPVDVLKRSDTLFLAGTNSVFRSFDLGTTWEKLETNYGFINVRDIIYADGTLFISGNLLALSQDFGETWLDFSNNLPFDFEFDSPFTSQAKLVNDNLFLGMNQGGIFVASWNEIVQNPNRFSWYKIGEGLEREFVTSLDIRNDKIYAGTLHRGLWSIDFTFNEPPMAAPSIQFTVPALSAPGTPVDTVKATDSDTTQKLIYQIIDGNREGLFTIDLDSGIISTQNAQLPAKGEGSYELTIEVKDDGIPQLASTTIVSIELTDPVLSASKGFEDLKVYPNPSPGTIALNLPPQGTSDYRLAIYHVSGKLIRSYHLSGNGEHTLDFSDLDRGIYLLKLVSKSFQATRKISIK